ncbi:MAG: DUF2240 family protein [Methanobacteriota archaeon]
MNNELRLALAYVFRAVSRDELSRPELIHALSLKNGWFSPGEARELVAIALARGELVEAGERLKTAFRPSEVRVDPSFRPTRNILGGDRDGILAEALRRLAASTGRGAGELMAEVNAAQESLGNKVSTEAAALLVAAGYGVTVVDLAAKSLPAADAPKGRA